jgi:large subunit ribosomal protein L24
MHIRKDDMVVVTAGDDKGSEPRKVLRALPKAGKIVVEGVNRVYKHLKPSAKNQQGGRLSKEMPIDASNVLLYCPACRRGVRVGHRFTAEGRKERYCKTGNESLGNLGPAKAARAK